MAQNPIVTLEMEDGGKSSRNCTLKWPPSV